MRGFRRELIEGVPVIRAPLYPSHGRSAVKRALNYLTFSLSATVASLFMARRPDVTYFYVPAVTASSPTLALKFLRALEDRVGYPGPVAGGIGRDRHVGEWSFAPHHRHMVLTCVPIERCDHCSIGGLSQAFDHSWDGVTQGSRHRELGAGRGSGDRGIRSIDSGPRPFGERRVATPLCGNMGPAQDLVSLLPAMLEGSVRNARVRLVLMGGGSEKEHVKEEIARLGLGNVSVLDAVPKSMAKAFIAQADAVLVHLKASPILDDTVPSKVQSYLASGTPIVAGVGKEAETIVLASGGGITFAQSSAQSFATALNKLFAMGDEKRREMGASAQEFYGQSLSMGRASPRRLTCSRDTVYGSGDSILRKTDGLGPSHCRSRLGRSKICKVC